MVVRGGLAAAPYLLALSEYDTAAALLEQAVGRDDTPAAAQAALPYLRQAARATGRIEAAGVLARVLARVDPKEAEELTREVLRRASQDGSHRIASAAAGELINLLRDSGRLAEALELADTMADHTREAGLGPWTQLLDQVMRLQVLHRMGHIDQVLSESLQLRDLMAELPDEPGKNETVAPWNVRESLLNVGTIAANSLRQWQHALDLAGETVTSLRQRGAGDHAIANARFNTYRPLLELGRLEQAEQVLLACQQVFEAEQDITALARTLDARATVASRRGHHSDAVSMQRTAIRLDYVRPQPRDVATGHHNLGLHLTADDGNPGEVIGHHLAAALLLHLIGDSHNADTVLHALVGRLQASPDLRPPTTLADLAAVVEQVEGVRYAALIGALSVDTHVADRALASLIDTARAMPPVDTSPDMDRNLAAWEPALATLVAAGRGDSAATRLLTAVLDRYADHPDWAALVERLRRIHTGDRDPDALLLGLDHIDTAIVRRALDALAGRIELSATPDDLVAEPADGATDLDWRVASWEPVLAALVAAGRGDSAAARQLAQVFDGYADHTDWAHLVDRLRRIHTGDRDPGALLPGLDPIDTAIVQRALDALAGRVELTAPPGQPAPDRGAAVDAFVDLVVAAARGVPDATAALTPLLDGMAADPDAAVPADRIRRILAGEREVDHLTAGVDPEAAPVLTAVLDRLRTDP
jgi:tetratricopeptide (TPR) repeat protein